MRTDESEKSREKNFFSTDGGGACECVSVPLTSILIFYIKSFETGDFRLNRIWRSVFSFRSDEKAKHVYTLRRWA